jgi:DNA-binding response OmpR family regulator
LVEDVGSGTAAVRLIERVCFDALVTDCELNDEIDGFDVLAKFNQVRPGKGKIVMSGRPDLQSRCDPIGAAYLYKPLLLNDLLNRIEDVLPQQNRSFIDAAEFDLIDRARSQRAACWFVKERTNKQRLESIKNRKLNADCRRGLRT